MEDHYDIQHEFQEHLAFGNLVAGGSCDTFTEAANESGMSRQYEGLHFVDPDMEGRHLGRKIAVLSWNKAQAYMLGTTASNRSPQAGK
jgi:hypothetical protein